MIVGLLARAEDLVARLDLIGVQDPFAVVAQRRRPSRDSAEAVDVAHLQIRTVDGQDAVRAGRDENPHQHVMVGVTDVVPLGLFADLERAHIQAGRHVRGTEHQSLHTRARRDRVDARQALGVLDLRLNTDAAQR